MNNLYTVSQQLVARRNDLFAKIQAHDPMAPESADLLWIEVDDDASSLCEGEVITISHEGDLWFSDHVSADKVGGWPTHWSASGSEREVVDAVLDYLAAE